MRGWAGFERRWIMALLGAMIPAHGHRPGLDELPLAPFWRALRAHGPWLLRVGLRASVWLLTWVTLLPSLGGRPFHRLDPSRQDRALVWASRSRLYLLRQVILTLKMIACLAYFADDGVRRGFDGVDVGPGGAS